MLPIIATWLAAGNNSKFSQGSVNLYDTMVSIYQHAFDPKHENYWGEANPEKADQRQVEACLVAYAFWLMGDKFAEQVGAKARTELQNWLASCTRVPEHKHNHAWFSAINQAARLQLAERWPEFKGDEDWMNADLQALDSMARPDSNGWYNDYPGYEVYDWYNFWTYASHFMYWREIAGDRYPQWTEKFQPRVKQFLQHAPEFFTGNGSHVLFGRSLIYRWASALPLVLAYRAGIWPHSPGMLRRLVSRNVEFFWQAGAFDEKNGKLRETFAPDSSPAIKERYVDNGHPYWCMQTFACLAIQPDDPFWTAPGDPLPVEKGDFETRYPALGMVVIGTQKSGQVRWCESRNLHRPAYRDKYIKFGYSSHFAFNVLDDPAVCPWDQTLVFRDTRTGESAGRSEIIKGELLPDGSLLTEWTASLLDCTFTVSTRVRLFDEYEERMHVIECDDEARAFVELLEGSYSHGVADVATIERQSQPKWLYSRNGKTGAAVFTANLSGYDFEEFTEYFGEPGERAHVLYPHSVVNTLRTVAGHCTGTFVSRHYASPQPYRLSRLLKDSGLQVPAAAPSDTGLIS
jgi:hypothetical protein